MVFSAMNSYQTEKDFYQIIFSVISHQEIVLINDSLWEFDCKKWAEKMDNDWMGLKWKVRKSKNEWCGSSFFV